MTVPRQQQPNDRPISRRTLIGYLGIGVAALATGCTAAAATPAGAPSSPQNSSTTPGAATGAAAGTAQATAGSQVACVLTPQQTEGPYFVDEKLERSDIRSDPSDGSVRPGVPLALAVRVWKVGGNACTPLAGAVVDIWHCDAAGVYSDVENAKGRKFLRGYQVTDDQGRVNFTTIYPGWYQGRAVHIHFKVRTNPASSRGQDATSQWYFDDTLNDKVMAQAPYTKTGRRTLNTADGIYRDGGAALTLRPIAAGSGYAATYDIGVQGA